MISFNGNNLESAYLLVNKVNKFDAPSRELLSETLTTQDGFELIRGYWRNRRIVIGGTLDASSSSHLGSLIDELKGNLSGINKNLDLDYGGETRRYKGTLSSFEAPEDFYNITHISYTAEFLCQPFGYAPTSISITADDVTASDHSETFSVIGSYNPQPVITLTFSAESGASAVSLENETTGETILIEHDFEADDVLTINTETHKVTVNSTQVDFDGPIIAFSTRDNTIKVAVDSSSHTYDLSITYTPRYL